ncbi:MAG: hypothetical protein EA391_00205 [Balneolaceae bacterium]|nr:MAG: hypothetical protein EA391_00205 [Balneolaceae bacterium]
MDKKEFVLLIIACIVLFIIGLTYGLKNNENVDSGFEGNIDLSGGVYVRFVFIGASDCFFANNKEIHHMINYIKPELDKALKNNSIKFISTGISYDLSSTTAIEYLKKTGPYDEVLAGGGAFNLGAIKYASGGSSTPKVLLFLEEYETELFGINMINFTDSQHLLKTYTGQFEIQELYKIVKQYSDSALADYLGITDYITMYLD